MPYTAKDARDLMIASVLSNDPVMFIEDRWLYEKEEDYIPVELIDLDIVKPQRICKGNDVTLVGVSYTSMLCEKAAIRVMGNGISCDVFDIRLLNPLKVDDIVESVSKTGRLIVADGDWSTCGMAGEIISSIMERIDISLMKKSPVRITLPDAPAPTSKILEESYYISEKQIIEQIIKLMK
jgi:pyruvate/2-oxoglutarate/acetoin dehydrogenase E1 component